jgi:hypothetical protein
LFLLTHLQQKKQVLCAGSNIVPCTVVSILL